VDNCDFLLFDFEVQVHIWVVDNHIK